MSVIRDILSLMSGNHWDLFVSHAAEDLESVARPLTEMLERRGVSVWIDQQSLVPGGGLFEQINNGLARSRHGAIVLSRAFLTKAWTNFEIAALVEGRLNRQKLLIPIWHDLDRQTLSQKWPLLCDIYAVRVADGLPRVVSQILRVLHPPTPIDPSLLKDREEFASEFVECLRQRVFKGRTFETYIGQLTMKEIRKRLRASDTEAILEILQRTEMDPELRNRAASILLGQRLKAAGEEKRRVAAEMRAFYVARASVDDWRVLRAIASALAYEGADPEPMRDWIARLQHDPGLAEANLRMTDTYNNGTRNAVNRFLARLLHPEPIGGRMWEVFYLGRRSAAGDQDVIDALQQCRQSSANAELRTLCEQALSLLCRRSAQNYEG